MSTRAPLLPFLRPLLCALLAAVPLCGFLNPLRDRTREGNAAYAASNFTQAIQGYTGALQEDPESVEVLYDLANVQYRRAEFAKAVTNYEKALYRSGKQLQQKIYYNQGASYFRLEEYDKAVDAFKHAVDLDPNDTSAKYNLEVARTRLREHSSSEKRSQNQPVQEQKSGSKQGAGKQGQQQQGGDQAHQSGPGNRGRQDQGQKPPENGQQRPAQGADPGGQSRSKPGDLKQQEAEQILQSVEDRRRNAQRFMKHGESVPGGRTDKDW